MAGKRRVVFLVVVIAFAAILSSIGILHSVLHRKLEAVLAPLRAAGVPLTLAELDAYYPAVLPEENAADAYAQALRALVHTPDVLELPFADVGKSLQRKEPIPEDMRQAMARHIGANAAALELLHGAAAFPRCRYPLDLSAGLAIQRGHFSLPAGEAARLLSAQAMLKAEGHDAAAAAQALTDLCAVQRSLTCEPLLNSQLARYTCDVFAKEALERCLNRTRFTGEPLARLAEAFAPLEVPESLTRAIYGELCLGLYRMEAHGPDPGAGPRALAHIEDVIPIAAFHGRRFASSTLGLRDWEKINLVRWVAGAAQASTLGFPEALGPARASRLQMGRMWFGWSSHVLASLYTSTGTVESAARDTAIVRILRTALAIERFHEATQRLPQSLEELSPRYLPEALADPFDGKPLRYRNFTSGYLVYSVGQNFRDEGGLESEQNNPRTGDLPFQVDLPRDQ